MSRRISIYVSATPDLESEREVIGEALARFVLPLAWEIRRTPHRGEQGLSALTLVAAHDFFVLLLGQDVSAPIGAELAEATAHRLPVLALRKDTVQTPAGNFFRMTSIHEWERFSDARAVRLALWRFLARQLTEQPLDYELSPDEFAVLQDFLRKPDKDQAAAVSDAVTGGEPAGAQEGAVIVAHVGPAGSDA